MKPLIPSMRFWPALCGGLLMLGLAACSGIKTVSTSSENTKTVSEKPKAGPAPVDKKEIAPMNDRAADLAGDYDITGTNPNGSAYKGTLKIIKQDAVYQFVWKAGDDYNGVGVQRDNTVAVAFGGKGCGVVHYRIGADGALDGKWGQWGVNESGTETATRTAGTGLAGEYDVTGTNLLAKPYKGKLNVRQDGNIYLFKWETGDQSVGLGIRQDDFVSVGYGGAECAFVSYKIAPDGSLDGKWGGYGSKETGTEKAVRAH